MLNQARIEKKRDKVTEPATMREKKSQARAQKLSGGSPGPGVSIALSHFFIKYLLLTLTELDA